MSLHMNWISQKVDLVGGTKYLPGAEFKLKNNKDEWVKVDTNNKVIGWANNKEDGSILETGDNGKCVIIGLDDGRYTLEETKAPEGYKLPDDPNTIIVIDANTEFTQGWTMESASDVFDPLQITVGSKDPENGDAESGMVKAQIPNSKLSTLPETGGIGTTIFYVVGGILVIGAAVLLITRRRMRK